MVNNGIGYLLIGGLTMSGRIIGWVMVFILGLEMATAVAQTCRNNIRATAPDSRFSDNGNGTVTDLATGLTWKQCAEGLSGAGCTSGSSLDFTWPQALQHAANAEFAGSSLWRLPNKSELVSLIERRCYEPAINARFFPNTPPSWFWSSSPYADFSHYAWYVDFIYGAGIGTDIYDTKYVRLVRDGQ